MCWKKSSFFHNSSVKEPAVHVALRENLVWELRGGYLWQSWVSTPLFKEVTYIFKELKKKIVGLRGGSHEHILHPLRMSWLLCVQIHIWGALREKVWLCGVIDTVESTSNSNIFGESKILWGSTLGCEKVAQGKMLNKKEVKILRNCTFSLLGNVPSTTCSRSGHCVTPALAPLNKF
jgi:hypothetical protein